MKNVLIAWCILITSLFAYGVYRSFEQFPDGAQIGPDVNGRLPMLAFDEYVVESGIESMSAGEIRVLTFEDCCTNFKGGSSLLVYPLNPELYNQTKLLISHSYVSEDGTVKVVVKNLDSSSVDFDSDQFVIGGWNTITARLQKVDGKWIRTEIR